MREERRLRVNENRVLRRIFGPKWGEVAGEWRKLYNEELNDCTPHLIFFRMIKSKKKEMGVAYSTYEERRVVYRVLVGKPEGKRPLGRPRRG